MEILKRISILSDKILDQILECNTGSERHMRLADRLEKLSKKSIKLRKKLGLYLHDPCPKLGNPSCATCDGYFFLSGRKHRCSLKADYPTRYTLTKGKKDEASRQDDKYYVC